MFIVGIILIVISVILLLTLAGNLTNARAIDSGRARDFAMREVKSGAIVPVILLVAGLWLVLK